MRLVILTRVYKTTFESAHCIEGHPRCGNKHGHSYNLTIKVTGDSGKWVDFSEIKDDTEKIVTEFDHKDLGDITAEEIGYSIANKLLKLGYAGQVELWETAKFGIIISMMNAAQEKIAFAKYK